MTVIFNILCFEFVSLLVLFFSYCNRRNKIDRRLYLTLILCLLNVAFSLTGFIDLRYEGLTSFLFKMVSASFGISCVLQSFILVLSASFILDKLKLQTKVSKIAFYVFWGFCIVDTILFASNIFTNFVYARTIVPKFDSPLSPAFFDYSEGKWLNFHKYFNLSVVLLTVVALLLKCVSVPFIYAEKYITLGIYFLITSIACFLSLDIFSSAIIKYYIFVAVINLMPFVLFYHRYNYRPRFLLCSLRQMVFDRLGTSVVLFDNEGLLADFNKDTEKLFLLDKSLINHLSLSSFLKRAVGNQLRERSTSTVEEVKIKGVGGEDLFYKLDYTKLKDKHEKNLGTLLMFYDITELKQLYNSMEKTAMTDINTGLASRIFLQKKITEINLYRKFPYTAVVCSINGINLITEGFGEESGKAATAHVAELLRSQLRASDFAAYDDGNMIVLMSDTTLSSAQKVFERLSRLLAQDRTFNFTLSFEYGIASRLTADTDMQLTVSQAQADMLRNKMKKNEEVHQSIIDSLRDALRLSSFETEQHSIRVQKLSESIAKKLKIPVSEMENLKNLALFHDIGKMSVPKEIMSKSSKLTEEETKIMQLHVINGCKIANASVELAPISRGILCHHERWDGNGYPNGYSGEQIPYLSRIVSVADTFDVITHDRPYKVAMIIEEAVKEIKNNSGKQFDPQVVNAFLSLENKERFV